MRAVYAMFMYQAQDYLAVLPRVDGWRRTFSASCPVRFVQAATGVQQLVDAVGSINRSPKDACVPVWPCSLTMLRERKRKSEKPVEECLGDRPTTNRKD